MTAAEIEAVLKPLLAAVRELIARERNARITRCDALERQLAALEQTRAAQERAIAALEEARAADQREIEALRDRLLLAESQLVTHDPR